jgi:hypothetical protein
MKMNNNQANNNPGHNSNQSNSTFLNNNRSLMNMIDKTSLIMLHSSRDDDNEEVDEGRQHSIRFTNDGMFFKPKQAGINEMYDPYSQKQLNSHFNNESPLSIDPDNEFRIYKLPPKSSLHSYNDLNGRNGL